MSKLQLLVIVGPTASGKSALAVKLAKKFNGEVISADSRQVYKGMDIGTGKVTVREMQGIPHYGLDLVSPKTEYNVAKFKKYAQKRIREIAARGKLPILVGGTGLWIDAVVYDLEIPEVKPDKKLRAELEKKSLDELFDELKKLNPSRAKTIERFNKRRLIRALEIARIMGNKIPNISFFYDRRKMKCSGFCVLILGIAIPISRLEKKIKKRLFERLDSGMIEEVRRLHINGVSWKRLDNFGLEYRYVSRFLRGLISKEEMIHSLLVGIRRYAERQMTWWKRNKEIVWIKNIGEATIYLK